MRQGVMGRGGRLLMRLEGESQHLWGGGEAAIHPPMPVVRKSVVQGKRGGYSIVLYVRRFFH